MFRARNHKSVHGTTVLEEFSETGDVELRVLKASFDAVLFLTFRFILICSTSHPRQLPSGGRDITGIVGHQTAFIGTVVLDYYLP